MVDIVILNRYIFTVFSYQFAILHRTSVSFLRVLQWFLLGLHVSNYTVFYCHFEYQSKKIGVCPYQMQTVSSGVLDGKLWQKCLTCSISYRFFLSYPIIAIAAVWSWLRAWSFIHKGQGIADCILRYVCLIHWFSSSSFILLTL